MSASISVAPPPSKPPPADKVDTRSRADVGAEQTLAGRYELTEELGRGGLAVVHRVFDRERGCEVALKQLALASTHKLFEQESAAFEREFHTLVQLSHPRIIKAYDFGHEGETPYYTMELLDGGDLRERAPLPWRQACSLVYDVCSSLALLHSRRLVHRDVSPRNVRSTLDGAAKLIDFGTLVPMGTGANLIGTPAFVAPEVLHRSALDGRTDLFSLGATLYFALTGHAPYPARTFADLHEAWGARPPAPSVIVGELPAALDALVLSLISLDPAARPRSAFEVMQHLSSIADLQRDEDALVSQAYLSAPVLVGRDAVLQALRAATADVRSGSGKGILVTGRPGMGRSRVLDACALEAKIASVSVVRVNALDAGEGPLCTARAFAEQLVQTLPTVAWACAEQIGVVEVLFEAVGSGSQQGLGPHAQFAPVPGEDRARAAYHEALTRWLVRAVGEQPLVALVDDADRADQASLSLLATLALSAEKTRLLLVASVESEALVEDAQAFAVLQRECRPLALDALLPQETERLVLSLFGDVPNAGLLADRLHAVGRGVPGEMMALVQGLLSRGTVRYREGRWVLPDQICDDDLPSSALEGCRAVVLRLSHTSSLLAQVQALASHPRFSRSDYALLVPEVSASQLDQAITELLSAGVLTGDGRDYSLSRREWSEVLLEGLVRGELADRHGRLAGLYEHNPDFAVERADHLLQSGAEAEGLDLLVGLLASVMGDSQGLMGLTSMTVDRLGRLVERALTCAEALQRSPRELGALRYAMLAVSVVCDETYYQRAAPAFLAQVEQDSGLAQYRDLVAVEDPTERLTQALTHAAERYGAMSEQSRGYNPEEAIRALTYYVVISIAVGSRMQDGGLIASLPSLLEPFAPLSPLLNVIWQNSIATRESVCDNRPERARERWQQVLVALDEVSSAELSYVAALRGAVIYGIGLIEARLGIPAAIKAASQLDDDPMQVVSAMALRKITRLHQGDFAGAERFRKLGEQRALQANLRSMFSSTLGAELVSYALASDLTGIEQVSRAMEPMVARFAGWVGNKHLADGCFDQIRGDFESALAAFERGLAVSDPVTRESGRACNTWPRLQAGALEVLVSLGRAEEARTRGGQALQACATHGIETSAFPIRRALAMAEAKLGDYEAASRRLDGVIDGLKALGVTGLELGVTYEARARIAIWFSDAEAVTIYGQLTAKEYRYGDGSALGARYERLMDEARGTGAAALPQLVDFKTRATLLQTRMEVPRTRLEDSLEGATTSAQRTERALRLLCEHKAAQGGHLYLRTERGCERVASLGAAADAELDELACRAIRDATLRTAQLDADETGLTATAAEEDVEVEAATVGWTDAHGTQHVPLLLMAVVEGSLVCAGAAIIAASERTPLTRVTDPLTDSVAGYLVRAGDVSLSAVES